MNLDRFMHEPYEQDKEYEPDYSDNCEVCGKSTGHLTLFVSGELPTEQDALLLCRGCLKVAVETRNIEMVLEYAGKAG